MAPSELPVYEGNELEIFAEARNWKAYWSSRLRPWLRGKVGEVGAGIGINTSIMQSGEAASWVCVEPDPTCFGRLTERLRKQLVRPDTELLNGTLATLPAERRFDCLVYIDVLEHIENDRQEVLDAFARLEPGGALVILVPAYQFLYSEFDRAIGHYRRYTLNRLRALVPPGGREAHAAYYDSVGLVASLANRLLLRQGNPGARQIRAWDRWMVPLSRCLDPVVLHSFGRSVVIVWRRDP